MKDFEHIRNQLNCFLHQDYDLDSKTVPQAIINAIMHSDIPLMIEELTKLQSESLEKIQEVLNDHDVYIWGAITPQELLITMKTFAILYLEEQRLDKINEEKQSE